MLFRSGNSRANLLSGLDGIDTLIGGGGNDRLSGDVGNDMITGGTGSDVFVFGLASGTDVIGDFTRKQDKLSITGITDISGLVITQVGVDTDIAFGSSHVVLTGITAATLTSSDFTFM